MKEGEAVSVVVTLDRFHERKVVRSAYVVVTSVAQARGKFVVRLHDFPASRVECAIDTEGTQWCHGHDGPAVDALHAAQALT